MNVASIDIGSNTILLLIAEVSDNKITKTILNEYRVPRISKGLSDSGEIIPEKVSLLLEILTEYKKLALEHNCSNVLLKATNALRIASNGAEIVELVKKELNLDVEIIPGTEEALLSYLGAKSYYSEFEKMFMLDIGGGSTEFVEGEARNIVFRKSFPRGAVNLTEQHISGYPISLNDKDNLKNSIDEVFHEIEDFSPNNYPLVAVAGTPTSLSCMLQNLTDYSEDAVEGSLITLDDLLSLSDKLAQMKPTEILSKYGEVVNGREDVIYTGSRILLNVMKKLGTDKLHVSGRGLRYGSIVKLISEKQ